MTKNKNIWESKSIKDLEGEIWKDVAGSKGEYFVSNLSRVKSLKLNRVKILKNHIINGRRMVFLRIDGKYVRSFVYRFVAKAFLLNPESKTQVNHINGIKTDDRLINLEWATNSENLIHARKNGLVKEKYNEGSNHGMAVLSTNDVKDILRKRKDGKKYKDLSKLYNVSISCIQSIVERRNWSNVK